MITTLVKRKQAIRTAHIRAKALNRPVYVFKDSVYKQGKLCRSWEVLNSVPSWATKRWAEVAPNGSVIVHKV